MKKFLAPTAQFKKFEKILIFCHFRWNYKYLKKFKFINSEKISPIISLLLFNQ